MLLLSQSAFWRCCLAVCRVLTVNEDLQSVEPERAAELMEGSGFVRTWPRTCTYVKQALFLQVDRTLCRSCVHSVAGPCGRSASGRL